MQEREPRKEEAKAVPEERMMRREEMRAGNVTPMTRATYSPAWYSRINWGSAIGGAFVGLASWLVLNALGYVIAFGTSSATSLADIRSIATGLGIWVAISAAISWFIGAYAASKFARARLASDGLWYGVAVWGFISMIGLLLSTLILPGLLSFVANWISAGLGIPNTANTSPSGVSNVVNVTMLAAGFVLATSLLGLLGSLLGGWLGSRRLSMAEAAREEAERERMAA
ncbi:MAG: hypothetical protein ACYC56_05615 [Candidatus Aquicultor sp.]